MHDNAFGCAFDSSKYNDLLKLSNEQLSSYDFTTSYFEVDFSRQSTAKDINDLICDLCFYSSKWMSDFPEPLIHIDNLIITPSDLTIMGKDKATLKIQKNGVCYLKFRALNLIEELKKNEMSKMEIVGRGNLNNYRGNITPQLFIDDYEVKKYSLVDF